MNLWGSFQQGENDEEDDVELGGGGAVDDREKDDLADLHPWKEKNDEDEKMEEETQADYVKGKGSRNH